MFSMLITKVQRTFLQKFQLFSFFQLNQNCTLFTGTGFNLGSFCVLEKDTGFVSYELFFQINLYRTCRKHQNARLIIMAFYLKKWVELFLNDTSYSHLKNGHKVVQIWTQCQKTGLIPVAYSDK